MNHWKITDLELKPHAPEILASTDDARAIVLLIPAGESLDDHQVHERAWLMVVAGEVEITTTGGDSVTGGHGLLVELSPSERHAVHARSDAPPAAVADALAGCRAPRHHDTGAEDQRSSRCRRAHRARLTTRGSLAHSRPSTGLESTGVGDEALVVGARVIGTRGLTPPRVGVFTDPVGTRCPRYCASAFDTGGASGGQPPSRPPGRAA